jgi:uncharacterized protein YdeI (YjbR/CyaY-like superfamily)
MLVRRPSRGTYREAAKDEGSQYVATMSEPRYFPSPAAFRKWLEKHHGTADELVVGFYKKATGKPSITWPQAVDEALCFGWIDGVRRRVDDERYTNRFTPRRPQSNWSAINIRRVGELEKLGRMTDAGRNAFERRTEARSALYSYENLEKVLPAADEKRFRAKKKAWKFFSDQPPSYRRVALHWVLSAKKPETRDRRFKTLIDDSAAGRRLGVTTPAKKR